jgi:membrane glycosyltransferase
MRIDEINKAKQARRRGFARRFIMALIWLAITILVAIYAVDWLLDSGRITYNQIIVNFGLSASVSTSIIRIGIIVLVVFVLQFLTLTAVALASPSGRERSGKPTARSKDLDVDERKFYR